MLASEEGFGNALCQGSKRKKVTQGPQLVLLPVSNLQSPKEVDQGGDTKTKRTTNDEESNIARRPLVRSCAVLQITLHLS